MEHEFSDGYLKGKRDAFLDIQANVKFSGWSHPLIDASDFALSWYEGYEDYYAMQDSADPEKMIGNYYREEEERPL